MVMRIKEVSQLTGLSKKTIRFYEEEGLIDPEKTYQNGRAYRTYTQAHIQTLNDVALLRQIFGGGNQNDSVRPGGNPRAV